MSDIEFNEDQNFSYPSYDEQEPGGLVSLVMKISLAKDEESANKMLMIIGVVAVVTIIVVFVFSGNSKELPPTPQDNKPAGIR